ncbi:hypothetical protein [Paenibacillus amylolyticus]|uniref:hypothetical protein n=1 Tax=Paenibacillus amylolyticus TaxID=1451 RepID=UPI003D95B4E8
MSQLTFEGHRPLKNNRSFVTLMLAQAISNLGDWLHLLAILTLVGIRWNTTPWEITFVTLSAALPILRSCISLRRWGNDSTDIKGCTS